MKLRRRGAESVGSHGANPAEQCIAKSSAEKAGETVGLPKLWRPSMPLKVVHNRLGSFAKLVIFTSQYFRPMMVVHTADELGPDLSVER